MCWFLMTNEMMELIKDVPSVDLGKYKIDSRIRMIKDFTQNQDLASKYFHDSTYLVILKNNYATCCNYIGGTIEDMVESLIIQRNEKETNFFAPVTDK